MTIFRTAHDTRTDRASIIDRHVDACVTLEGVEGRLTHNAMRLPSTGGGSANLAASKEPGTVRIGIVTPLTVPETQMLPFFHPLEVKFPALGDKPAYTLLVGDARPFLKRAGERELMVTNAMELEFLTTRLALTAEWLANGPLNIYRISATMVKIYSSWIANRLTSVYALDLQEQAHIRIIAAHFFQCLHSERSEIVPENHRATAAVLSRQLNVSTNEVDSVIEHCGVVTDIDDFVVKLKSLLNTPRLTNLNTGTLVTLMSGTWFGVGGAQSAGVAIEHPPTFAAMVYLSFDQRGYRRAGLAEVAKSFKGAQGEVEIVRSIKRIRDAWL